MSIVVRYTPPSLTTTQYDEADRLLREAGVEPLPDGLEYHVCFGTCVSARSGTRGSSSRRMASG
jgi:hypothetical protein